ncbi:hypothetical protein [Micromonospora sp. NPDC005652]|uniref:hypothetical protein n=1 Tax=Micromonospora sp. NPDC005652 TaxID=3157046 RepID=UPI0033ED74CD
MSGIVLGAWGKMTAEQRRQRLGDSLVTAQGACARYAGDLLCEAIVRVREHYPTAARLEVVTGWCEERTECDATHAGIAEIRDDFGGLLWRKEPGDDSETPWDVEPEGASDRSVHALVSTAANESWEPFGTPKPEQASYLRPDVAFRGDVYDLRFAG